MLAASPISSSTVPLSHCRSVSLNVHDKRVPFCKQLFPYASPLCCFPQSIDSSAIEPSDWLSKKTNLLIFHLAVVLLGVKKTNLLLFSILLFH
jgi:hypothetical protein